MTPPCHAALWTAAAFLILAGAAADQGYAAEDEMIASLRLRGGYDSNPVLLAAPRGLAFAGMDAVAVLGRKADGLSAGLVAEASHTRYEDASVDPVQRYKLRAQFENPERNGLSVRSAASLGYFSNYETRAFEAEQSVRVQRAEGTLRPFVSAAVRYSALNETSAVLGEFLPDAQRFLRGTIIPGVAVKHENFEIGASVNLSATRYDERLDFFGYRRDNERIEPFLFASYAGDKLSIFASLSRLYGDWHDVDFTDVRRTMFELTMSYRGEKAEAEFSASRFATDTTFPISPISVDTELSGKLTRHLDSATRVALFGRVLQREFLDSKFRSRQTAFGLEAARDIGADLTLAAEVSRVRMQPIVGEPLYATVASVSVTRRYGADPENKLRAGASPPPARPSR